MKTVTKNSRRQFLGAIALGATASTLTVLTNPIYANTPIADSKKLEDAENWFEKIKGKHRIVYDGSEPNSGFPIIWNWAFYLTNNGTGTPDEDMTAMTVLRHEGLPFAFEDRIWKNTILEPFLMSILLLELHTIETHTMNHKKVISLCLKLKV